MSESVMAPSTTRVRTPLHLWIVGTLALLWNAFGAFNYLAFQLEWEWFYAQTPQEQVDYFLTLPGWAVAMWALGVWGGVAGALGLLLRRRWAVWAFAISLFGMVVNSVYTFTEGLDLLGMANLVFSLVIWIVQIALLVYAVRLAQKGVLK